MNAVDLCGACRQAAQTPIQAQLQQLRDKTGTAWRQRGDCTAATHGDIARGRAWHELDCRLGGYQLLAVAMDPVEVEGACLSHPNFPTTVPAAWLRKSGSHFGFGQEI